VRTPAAGRSDPLRDAQFDAGGRGDAGRRPQKSVERDDRVVAGSQGVANGLVGEDVELSGPVALRDRPIHDRNQHRQVPQHLCRQSVPLELLGVRGNVVVNGPRLHDDVGRAQAFRRRQTERHLPGSRGDAADANDVREGRAERFVRLSPLPRMRSVVVHCLEVPGEQRLGQFDRRAQLLEHAFSADRAFDLPAIPHAHLLAPPMGALSQPKTRLHGLGSPASSDTHSRRALSRNLRLHAECVRCTESRGGRGLLACDRVWRTLRLRIGNVHARTGTLRARTTALRAWTSTLRESTGTLGEWIGTLRVWIGTLRE